MRVLVTGGAGFIGSNAARYFAEQGHDVVVLDNLSRAELLKRTIRNVNYNWNLLKSMRNIELVRGDVRNKEDVKNVIKDADVVIHTAGQTAVTTSVTDPETDFSINAAGTVNVLDAARTYASNPAFVFTSTNKVYGSNVNSIGVVERARRYEFSPSCSQGVSEAFNVDHCEHSPYGCSKLAADLYVQDYAHIYGMKTAVFRMSCIYGPMQFGVEDQGWLAWFAIATLLAKPITIFGDGKQVRDVLFVSDLVDLFDCFVKSRVKHCVVNVGGGCKNTLSLLELLEALKAVTGKRSELKFGGWRPGDQKVYVSDISKAKELFGWEPKVSPEQGVRLLVDWVGKNKDLF